MTERRKMEEAERNGEKVSAKKQEAATEVWMDFEEPF